MLNWKKMGTHQSYFISRVTCPEECFRKNIQAPDWSGANPQMKKPQGRSSMAYEKRINDGNGNVKEGTG